MWFLIITIPFYAIVFLILIRFKFKIKSWEFWEVKKFLLYYVAKNNMKRLFLYIDINNITSGKIPIAIASGVTLLQVAVKNRGKETAKLLIDKSDNVNIEYVR